MTRSGPGTTSTKACPQARTSIGFLLNNSFSWSPVSSLRCSAFARPRHRADPARTHGGLFFEGDLMPVVEAPHRAHRDAELLLSAKSLADFLERQIRLFCHEIKQPLLVRLERRATVTGPRFGRDVARPAPPIEPTHRCGGCKVEQTRDLPPALSLLDHRNRTLPQVFRVPLRHGFPPSVSTEHSNLICATAGIPRGNSDSHQAETALAIGNSTI